MTERGGAARAAADDVGAPPKLTAEELARELAYKAHLAAQRVAGLRRVVREAQEREAVVRTELTLGLAAALARQGELALRFGRRAQEARRSQLGPPNLRPRSRKLDDLLLRLGSLGQALVLARSGTWRGTGRRLFDLRHMAAYARRRSSPDAAPPTFFDQAWYIEQNPEVAAGGLAPLTHYLLVGSPAGRAPHQMFDEVFYRRRYGAEFEDIGLSALEHYMLSGAARGFTPHPLFDESHYLAQAPALAEGEEPLAHYARAGWREGLSPHPLFDPAWYQRQAPDCAGPPLLHYLAEGWRRGLRPHRLFDPTWYLERNVDVAETGEEPLTHYVLAGAAEGRAPGPWFDPAHYAGVRGPALPTGANPLVDYLQGGAWAVAEPYPGFLSNVYLATYPELVQEGLTPLEHWVERGGA